jgi:ubiquinone biosynthesis protein COQ9
MLQVKIHFRCPYSTNKSHFQMTNDELITHKNALLQAFLDNAAFAGLSQKGIAYALRAANLDEGDGQIIAPNGAISLIDYWFLQADDFVLATLSARKGLKIREKATLAVRSRLEFLGQHREALRHALMILSLPHNLPHSLSIGYRFVDKVWRTFGDKSTDFNYYTKRTMLLAVDASTATCFLGDESDEYSETWEFLDRRIENIMQIEKAKFKFREFKSKLPDPVPLLAGLRFGKRPLP